MENQLAKISNFYEKIEDKLNNLDNLETFNLIYLFLVKQIEQLLINNNDKIDILTVFEGMKAI